jgi:hypothetical protein
MDLSTVFTVGVAFVVFSIPLILGWVPRNRLYGFRVPATMRDDGIWYAVNRRAGWESVVIGAPLAIFAAGLDVAGWDTPLIRGIAVATMFAAMAVFMFRNWRLANRMARDRAARP